MATFGLYLATTSVGRGGLIMGEASGCGGDCEVSHHNLEASWDTLTLG